MKTQATQSDFPRSRSVMHPIPSVLEAVVDDPKLIDDLGRCVRRTGATMKSVLRSALRDQIALEELG